MFLWHFPSSCPDRTLSCTLPAEARTFLTLAGAVIERASRGNYSTARRAHGTARPAKPKNESGACRTRHTHGGGKETRTPDPHAASVMLYQLSYAPATRPYSRRQARLLRSTAGNANDPGRVLSRRNENAGPLRLGGRFGDVAQLVEHLLCKQRVSGSSPLISTFSL
jgi:hypothetical protein